MGNVHRLLGWCVVVAAMTGACGGGQIQRTDGGAEAAADRSGRDASIEHKNTDGPIGTEVADGQSYVDGGTDRARLDAGVPGVDGGPIPGCVADWPQMSPARPQSPLTAQPGFLWMTAVPKNVNGGGLLTVAGSGVAVSAGTTLVILGADGRVVASVNDSGSSVPISTAVATADGGLLFSDDQFAHRIDVATGSEVWRTMVGRNQNPSELVSPATPVLDPSGRLYVSGLDGNLWVLEASGGAVIGTSSIGLAGSPHMIELGVGGVLFIDRAGISNGALGIYALATDSWQAELRFHDTNIQPNVIAGFQIGIVQYGWINTSAETSRTAVLDSCGNPRWTVPGNYSYPLVIGFDDDLIVRDKTPLGNQTYSYSLRRFSRDGVLLASSDETDLTFASLGADDVLYFCNAAGTGFVGLDRSLMLAVQIPLPSARCSGGQTVLNSEGRLFFQCVDSSNRFGICAVQTTSPGPAPVSWSRQYGRDTRSTFWLAP